MQMKIIICRNLFASAINVMGFGNVRTVFTFRLCLVYLVLCLPLHLFSQEQPSLMQRKLALKQSEEFCADLNQFAGGNTDARIWLTSLLEFNQNQAYDDICGSNKEISFLSLLNCLAKVNGKYRIECQQTARKEELSWFESAWPNGSTNTDPAYVIVVPIHKKVNGRQTEGLLLVRAVSGKIVNYYKTVPTKFKVLLFSDSPQPVPQPEPSAGQTFTDQRDGHVYRIVTINNQVWMAENLAYKPTSGKFWDYSDYKDKQWLGPEYGYLYDWETARKVCPSGWHLPNDDEWTMLTKFVGRNAGKKLKSAKAWVLTPGYNESDGSTDSYEFSAVPGGTGRDRGYSSAAWGGFWWTSTEVETRFGMEAYCRFMRWGNDRVQKEKEFPKTGLSVRCLRDK